MCYKKISSQTSTVLLTKIRMTFPLFVSIFIRCQFFDWKFIQQKYIKFNVLYVTRDVLKDSHSFFNVQTDRSNRT